MQTNSNVFPAVNYLLRVILATYSPQPQDVTIYTCPPFPIGEEVILSDEYPVFIDNITKSPIYFIYVITNAHLSKMHCPLGLEVLQSISSAWKLPRNMYPIIITDNKTLAENSLDCCPRYFDNSGQYKTLVIEYLKTVQDSIEYIKDNEIRLYRYASNIEYEHDVDLLVQLDTWNIAALKFKWNNDLFPGIRNGYWDRCIIDVLDKNTSALDGLDSANTDSMFVKIARELVRYYNFTEELRVKIADVQAENHIRYIQNNYGNIPLAKCVTKYIVPMPKINPNVNINLLYMLEWSVWLLIILSFVFGRVAFYIMDSTRLNAREKPISSFDIVSLILGQTFNTPRVTHLSRFIYAFCLLMLLYFNAMFSGGILRTIVVPSYIKNYKTFADISDDKDLVYLPTLHSMINHFEGNYMFSELQNITGITNGLLAKDTEYNYFMMALQYDDKYIDLLHPPKTKYKILNQEIEDASCSLAMASQYRYFRDYKFYSMILSTGLANKWMQEDYNKPEKFQEISAHWHPQINDKVILEFQHIKSILFVWLIGIICALLGFSLEFLKAQIEFQTYIIF